MGLEKVAGEAISETGEITWTAIANADGIPGVHYKIFKNGSSTPIVITRGLTYTDSAYTSSDTYTIKAEAWCGTSAGALSDATLAGNVFITIKTSSVSTTWSVNVSTAGGSDNPDWTESDGVTQQTNTTTFTEDLSGNGGDSEILYYPATNQADTIYSINWSWKEVTELIWCNFKTGIDNFKMDDCANLVMDIPALLTLETNLVELKLNRCDLPVVATTLALNTNLTAIHLQDCVAATADVDAIVIEVESWGTSNGDLDLSGTNGAMTTGGAEATAKTALEGRGWTVTVN